MECLKILLIILLLILFKCIFSKRKERFHDNQEQLKNIYGKDLERCRKFEDDQSGSWDNRGLCSEQGVHTGLHQICFGLNEDTSNFSESTGQSSWSRGRISNRENNENNHCMCLGAWSLYKARQNRGGGRFKFKIPKTNNELICRSIPDTVFLPEYVKKWNTWNTNEIPNQVVDGMNELVYQCLEDAQDDDEKKYLINQYCELADSKKELQNFDYNLICKNTIDLTNINPNNKDVSNYEVKAKYEKKVFSPMFLNPIAAKKASKTGTIHLSVPGLMPASPDYWIDSENGNRNQIFYMPNDLKPHFHGDAPHHQAKFDIDKVWITSKNKYVKVKSKQIPEFRNKPGIIRFNEGMANTPVELWIHWRIPYNRKEYPRLKVLKDSIIWWDFLSMHNLVQVNSEEDYNNNNFNDVKVISTDKKEKETLITIMDEPGIFYFACSVKGHALQGHKIVIEVI